MRPTCLWLPKQLAHRQSLETSKVNQGVPWRTSVFIQAELSTFPVAFEKTQQVRHLPCPGGVGEYYSIMWCQPDLPLWCEG